MYVSQQALTVIVEVQPDKLDNLRDLLHKINHQTLRQIENRSLDEPIIFPFEDLKTVHFSRFFLLDNLKDTNGESYPPMLGFTTNFDGKLNAHLKEISEVASLGLDRIYSHCKGYPPKPKAKDRIKYLKSNNLAPKLFWGSKFGHTVADMRAEGKLRNAVNKYLDDAREKEDWSKISNADARQRIVQFIKNREDLRWAINKHPKPSTFNRILYWGKLARILGTVALMLLSALFFLVSVTGFNLCEHFGEYGCWVMNSLAGFLAVILLWLGAWILIGRIYEKKDDQIRAKTPPPDARERERIDKRYYEMLDMEDQFFQNQLTVYGTIKQPYWFKRTTLKIALKLFALNGAYRSTKGKLSGIPTIHFARWIMFNKNRNVMFLSNYNGNWENYLSEFIERSAPAMNLTLGQMVGYPQVKWLIGKGAHDEQLFKKVVRENQYPSQVFYSAYPDLTVRNILNNSRFRDGLHQEPKDEEELKAWLGYLY
jgi:hypothetical protein